MERLKVHFRKHAVHYVAVLVYYALATALLSKSFDGYVVSQGDIKNWVGMSKEVQDAKVLFGEDVGWTNSMFGGMPTTHILPSKPTYDIVNGTKRLVNSFVGFKGISFFWLAMIGGYVLALALGASPWIGLLCGLGMGLSSFELLYFSAGHNTKVQAVAYMPFVLAGVIWAYRERMFIGAAFAAYATAMHISAGHPQMTYYLAFLLLAIGLTETLYLGLYKKNWSKAMRIGVLLLMAGSVGALPRFAHLKETKENAKYTIRGERLLEAENNATPVKSGLDPDYILEYSLADGEWLSILCPDIKGGNSPLYWGEQSFSGGAFYFGAILVALFFMFLIAGRDRLKWPLLFITILSIILSRREVGVVMEFFLDHVPAFGKFRDTKMMMVLVLMAVAMGAALGLKELVAEVTQPGGMSKKRRLLWSGSALGLVLLFTAFYGIPELFFDFKSTIRPDVAVEQLGYQEALSRRLELFRADVLRTIGLLLILTVTIAAVVWNKVKPTVALIGLAVVTTIDLWNVDHRYFSNEKVNGEYRNWIKLVDHAFPFTPEPQMMKLLEKEFSSNPINAERADRLYANYLARLSMVRLTRAEKDRLRIVSQFGALRFNEPYRLLRWGSPFNDASASYFFQSVGGYHAAKLRRYQDFVDRVLLPEHDRFSEKIRARQVDAAFASLVGHQMLNTRYILLSGMPDPLELEGSPGHAWVASNWQWAETNDDEINQTAAFVAPQQTVVHREFEGILDGLKSGATGEITLANYTPDYLEYEANLASAGLVIFSEIWYPEGWTAYIDGEAVETLRANYVLRAMKVPAGKHSIVWEYDYERSHSKDVLFNLILLLFILGTAWWGWKESNEGIEAKADRA
jgi:hypothetical protein